MTSPLFKPLQLGAISLSHRVVMAPLTRMRAGAPDNVPTELSVEYYRQRASSGGLIIARRLLRFPRLAKVIPPLLLAFIPLLRLPDGKKWLSRFTPEAARSFCSFGM